MVFYNDLHSTGRVVLIDALACPDPFGISPLEIVERILAAGTSLSSRPPRPNLTAGQSASSRSSTATGVYGRDQS